jgi:hypothetical protein
VSSQPRPDAWLAGLVLGVAGGVMLLTLGAYGMLYLLACVGLVLWKGPRFLASAGIVTGVGLVSTVLFARVALTCGGPLDPHVSQCSAPDLTGWVVGSAAVFAMGLFASAVALRRSRS